MIKGYWIAQIDVEDGDAFKAYGALSTQVVTDAGGRFLVRGGATEHVEGTSRARTAVVEFDSYELALACYHSAAYQAAAKVRQSGAVSDIVIAEGVK